MNIFINYRVMSDYSFGKSAAKISDIVKTIAKFNQPAVGLMDDGNMHGVMEFADKCIKDGIQPIIGCRFNFLISEKDKGLIFFIAKNERGYINICKIMNYVMHPGRKNQNYFDSEILSKVLKSKGSENDLTSGVVAIIGVGGGGVIGEILKLKKIDDESKNNAEKFIKLFDKLYKNNLYLEICRNGGEDEADVECEEFLKIKAIALDIPLIATTEVRYETPDRKDAYLITEAVAKKEKSSLSVDIGKGILGERGYDYHLRDNEEIEELFEDVPEAKAQTFALARRCGFIPAKRNPILPPYVSESGLSEALEMGKQAREGLKIRLKNKNMSDEEKKEYEERLEYELKVIEEMKFPGYFLIVSDFIKWAKNNGISVGPGRGSGAGSVVAWSLFITDLDPLRFGLLFERFLNPERVSMPDFDVDFCPDRREEVINYVKEKYGEDKVSQIATFMIVKPKSAIRDVSRVVSHTEEGPLAQREINAIADLIPDDPAHPKSLSTVYEEVADFKSRINENLKSKCVFENALKIEGLHRNSSTHAAGIIIAGDDLTNLVPIGFDPRSNFPVVQFDMKNAEKSGLVKFDFLGLKNLSIIREAIDNIRVCKKEDIDISNIKLDDENVFAMLAEGKSNGIFQLESEGMKKTLREMRISRFEDLIAAVALYRPGPMEMIPSYCKRKNGEEDPEYLEPEEKTKEFLEETFGIIVYQEQVMKAAQVIAGYSLGQADILRRAMGKKIKSEMEAQRSIFVKGAVNQGLEERQANETFDLLAKFADYGFNKSHAAAYALIAYQTAWLKKYYPVEYFSALLSYEDKPERMALFKKDMDEIGIELLPPDINTSFINFMPEEIELGKWGVRFGLKAIKSISGNLDSLIAEREKEKFKNLRNFHERVGTLFNIAQVTAFAEAGAFDCISPNKNRRRAADTINFLNKNARKDMGIDDLFGGEKEIIIPKEIEETAEWPDLLDKEYNAVGFFFKKHPIDDLEEDLIRVGIRRRDSIIKFFRGKRLTEMRGRKLCGIVEKADIQVSSYGKPHLRVLFEEKSDRYWLRVYPKTDIDLVLKKLEGQKKTKRPVVCIADFAEGRSENEIRIDGREIYDAEEYIDMFPSRKRIYLTIDTKMLRTIIPPQINIDIKGMESKVEKKEISREDAKKYVSEVMTPYVTGLLEKIEKEIKERCKKADEEKNEDTIFIKIILSACNEDIEYTISNIINGYKINKEMLNYFRVSVPGIVSCKEISLRPE